MFALSRVGIAFKVTEPILYLLKVSEAPPRIATTPAPDST
jgi:hypothetical protein